MSGDRHSEEDVDSAEHATCVANDDRKETDPTEACDALIENDLDLKLLQRGGLLIEAGLCFHVWCVGVRAVQTIETLLSRPSC